MFIEVHMHTHAHTSSHAAAWAPVSEAKDAHIHKDTHRMTLQLSHGLVTDIASQVPIYWHTARGSYWHTKGQAYLYCHRIAEMPF